MPKSITNLYIIIVQAITLSRAISALLFISIAFISEYNNLATLVFVYACASDGIDGYLARKFNCSTKLGGVLDLFSDKYLTIISLVYAIAKDLPVVPCGIAILREVFLLSIRSVTIEGKSIFPPQRILGTITIMPIWIGTIVLLQYPKSQEVHWVFFDYYYWIIGVISFLNLSYKIIKNRKLLIKGFNES